MAFVVPAEIGHAPYAAPVLDWFARHFDDVQVVAVRQELFADLSEDVWLLYAGGFGGRTGHFDFALHERFVSRPEPPIAQTRVSVREWRRWGSRLRSMLLPSRIRDAYENLRDFAPLSANVRDTAVIPLNSGGHTLARRSMSRREQRLDGGSEVPAPGAEEGCWDSASETGRTADGGCVPGPAGRHRAGMSGLARVAIDVLSSNEACSRATAAPSHTRPGIERGRTATSRRHARLSTVRRPGAR